MSDGVKGGDVNRPGSRPEIQKLPRLRCQRCGLEQVAPIVRAVGDGNRCSNDTACNRRVLLALKRQQRGAP